ncbi:MAG: ComEC/Rec2 family competence protein [Nocardioidaceae bacterium]
MTPERLDLRLLPAALAAWLSAAVGVGWSPGRAVLTALLLLGAGALAVRLPTGGTHSPGWRTALAAVLVVSGAALAVAGLRGGAAQAGPLPELAAQRAQVTLVGTVASDPVEQEGTFEPYVVLRFNARRVAGRGQMADVRSPTLVIADPSWSGVSLGERVELSGRLEPSRGRDLAGVVIASGPPTVVDQAGWMWRGVAGVRSGILEAATPLPPAQRALLPALVDGDDSQLPDEVTSDFQRTGLTHLLAVSGSNLTLVLAFALFVASRCGVRSWGTSVVGLVCVVFFVLLARPEPSVLRAAAMGVVALAGLSTGSRRRGVRALCVCVVCLVLLDPWLARSIGFALSTLATAGILLLAPGWRDAMARWMPQLVAEAIAVPLSAQIVCTPLIAAISGQVSLVAVLSNLLAAPAVGPATVGGLVAGAVAMVQPTVGHLAGHVAGVPAWWIITVARHTAELDGASIAWPVGPVALTALTGASVVLITGMRPLLSHSWSCLVVVLVLLLVVVRPLGSWGWPPDHWLMVMCDVGQGDGLVLNAGGGTVIVVDTGPDPPLMDKCLDRLHVDRVALVVLTHFHADHVNGLPGVLGGRLVAEIEVSPLADPPDRAAAVMDWAAAAAVPVTVAVPGEQRTVGRLSWTVLGPLAPGGVSVSGSAPNNASVAMALTVDGHRFLLTGDAEPEEQGDLLESGADLRSDVLKVAHHGSANQDPDFVAASAAPVALISVGADNDYGHPAQETLTMLAVMGARVYRTDLDGDIAVGERAGELLVETSKR